MPRIKFSKLPTHIQQRLLERQSSDEAVTIHALRTYMWPLLAASSAIWLVILFLLSNSFRWSNASLVLLGTVTVVAVFFFVRGIQYLVRLGAPRNCLMVTRHYLVDFQDDYVSYQSIENLVTVNSSHKYESGKYKQTQIDLILEKGVRSVYVRDPDIAEDAVDQIAIFKKHFLEASDRGDTQYLEMHDDFRDLTETFPADEQGPIFQLPFKTALAALIVGVGITAAAALANEYFDDVRSWDLARAGDRASGYRSYLATHPKGRWSADSAERLQALYDAAETKYRSSLNDGYDKEAANALSAILRYAKETGNYRVEVVFDRRVDVPDNLIEEIKSEFEVEKVLPLDDTFSNEKMLRRETALLVVLSEALKQIFPEDILEATHACSDECAKFLVTYETTFKDSIYYDTKEKPLPEAERTYSPGILISWKFGISLPRQNAPYEFELESAPAETINYDAASVPEMKFDAVQQDVEKIEKNNLYDAMVNSAFVDFRQHLVFRMGIGPPPKDSVEPESGSPTPDNLKFSERTDASKDIV